MYLPKFIHDDLPLRVLFLDLNSYFASVEQQADPSLRGKPVAVAPMDTDSTCAIAASYEAKAYGVKTGTMIAEAKQMCPDLIVVQGRPALYVRYHKEIVETVESVLPVEKVCSIDEMSCRLIGKEGHPENARKLALRIKRAIRDRVGECLTSSIGIAPNGFLAKLATEMEKPNGLVVLTKDVIEERATKLQLMDFTGINRRMKARLQAAGIFTAEQLYAASPMELRLAFGSVIGERWWYLLRGYEIDLPETRRRSLGHSHVLPPNLRTREGSRLVLMRLISKAAARMRSLDLAAGEMSLYVKCHCESWKCHTRIEATNQTQLILKFFEEMWEQARVFRPKAVGVSFSRLVPVTGVTPSLFSDFRDTRRLDAAIDDVNNRFGKNSVYLASVEKVKDTASEKIAFQKVDLFSEGRGDNEWPDPFRGVRSD
jgi:DNA polymerase-4